jgi:N-acetylmuramoyl-L-alanine amidase
MSKALFALLLSSSALAVNIVGSAAHGKIYPPDVEQRVLIEANGKQSFYLVGSRFALVDGILTQLALPFEYKLTNTSPAVLENTPKISVQFKAPKASTINNSEAQFCSARSPVERIFLDPGHGGTDLGASIGRLHEKDITLSFAKLVDAELKAQGFKVTLSRSRDVVLPLDIRTQLAQQSKAQVFISIHMNSSPSSEAHGTETYILSADATDAEARKLAIQENSILKQVPSSGANAVRDILYDMEQTVYLQESAYLAAEIQQSTVRAAHALLKDAKVKREWKDRGVRQAPFFVLSRASMPAVLLELGYLSSPHDRAQLLSQKFQASLAKALAEGVKMYRESCKFRK